MECSGLFAAWLNAVSSMQHDWMQWILCSMAQCFPIECSGFHAAWFNAVDSMQLEKLKPIECFGFHAEWFKAVDSMQHRKWFPNECSGFHTAWFNASQLNAVDFMQHDWMQWIPCSIVQLIPIECSGFHAAWLNAVDFMQHGPKHPDWVSGFHAVWCNWFSLNALIPCIKAQWFLIECTRFHAAF